MLSVALAATSLMLVVMPAVADSHRGPGGGGSSGSGGGGAPLPALGATLIGQAVGGGAIYAVWRRRRSRKQRPD